MLTLNQRPHPIPDLTLQQPIAGETLLVTPAQGKVRVLNPAGSRIWSLVDGALTAGEIALRLAETYAIPREQAEADTLAFLQSLHERGLITLEVE
ncbi:MAG TPA: PqqD family protein [Anaerolineaceae bacterium]|nr:PqqD family protein [Anaerolineaceae bacterium]HPN51845.1 PqqD family protein [Anaerolineaceae bacterium]